MDVRLRIVADISEIRYAQSGDLSVAYQVIGDGPRDLIFVPGIVSHVEFFHQLPGYTEFLEGLAAFARVVVLDKRGNGLSDRVMGASSLEERMDDIRAVMDAVGSERATLFGVSEGGPISLLFTATYPSRVEAVVLYETFVCYGGVPGELESHAGDEPDAHKQFTDYLMETYGTGESLLGFGTSRIEEPRVVTLWALLPSARTLIFVMPVRLDRTFQCSRRIISETGDGGAIPTNWPCRIRDRADRFHRRVRRLGQRCRRPSSFSNSFDTDYFLGADNRGDARRLTPASQRVTDRAGQCFRGSGVLDSHGQTAFDFASRWTVGADVECCTGHRAGAVFPGTDNCGARQSHLGRGGWRLDAG